MEAKKRVKPIVVVLLILLSLLLVFCCCVSAGITKFQPFDLRYSIHLVSDNSLTGGVCRGEFLLLDRDTAPEMGSVVYLPSLDAYQGVAEVSGNFVKLVDGKITGDVIAVRSKLSLLASVMCFLQDYPIVSFAAIGAFALILVLVKVTAPGRWKKRQQKLIRENLAKFGAQYAKEEENVQY